MRVAGTFLSGFGHAGVIGIALVGPPFLWAPRDAPVPAVLVSLVTTAELAALAPPPPPAAEPAPAAPPPPMPPPLALPKTMEPVAMPPPTTLAPGFDAGAAIGVEAAPPTPAPADPGAAEAAEAAAEEDPAALWAAYAARVQKAVTRARVYPQVARDRGLEGRVALQLVLGPDGRLAAAQLLSSSGAMTLDRAALETVRRAVYPPPPAGIGPERPTVGVEVVFAGSDR